jgi:hypothetical protein
LPIVFFQQIGLVIGIRSNFRPTATRFEGEATVGNVVFLVGPRMQLHCMRY